MGNRVVAAVRDMRTAATGAAKPFSEDRQRGKRGARGLSDDKVSLIKRDLETMCIADVARHYGVRPGIVRNIYYGITYADVKPAK